MLSSVGFVGSGGGSLCWNNATLHVRGNPVRQLVTDVMFRGGGVVLWTVAGIELSASWWCAAF